VLTGLSTFWFERTAEILPNHLVSVTDGVPRGPWARHGGQEAEDASCGMRGPRLHHGVGLEGLPGHRFRIRPEAPDGLRESDQLPEPLFTPSTKAESVTTRRSTSQVPPS